jgi:hypothetical protein
LEIFIWMFINVGIAACAPIAISFFSRSKAKGRGLGEVLGDGFLFFFTVILATGLVSDLLKVVRREGTCPLPRASAAAALVKATSGAAQATSVAQPSGCVNPNLMISVVLGAFVVAGATLIAYWAALQARNSDTPSDGKSAALGSIALSVAALVLTIYVRHIADLW